MCVFVFFPKTSFIGKAINFLLKGAGKNEAAKLTFPGLSICFSKIGFSASTVFKELSQHLFMLLLTCVQPSDTKQDLAFAWKPVILPMGCFNSCYWSVQVLHYNHCLFFPPTSSFFGLSSV